MRLKRTIAALLIFLVTHVAFANGDDDADIERQCTSLGQAAAMAAALCGRGDQYACSTLTRAKAERATLGCLGESARSAAPKARPGGSQGAPGPQLPTRSPVTNSSTAAGSSNSAQGTSEPYDMERQQPCVTKTGQHTKSNGGIITFIYSFQNTCSETMLTTVLFHGGGSNGLVLHKSQTDTASCIVIDGKGCRGMSSFQTRPY